MTSTSTWLKSKHPFEGLHESELSFKPGEYFEFLEDMGDGWFAVMNTSDKQGIVPATYVDFLDPEELDELLDTEENKEPQVISKMKSMNLRATQIEREFQGVTGEDEDSDQDDNIRQEPTSAKEDANRSDELLFQNESLGNETSEHSPLTSPEVEKSLPIPSKHSSGRRSRTESTRKKSLTGEAEAERNKELARMAERAQTRSKLASRSAPSLGSKYMEDAPADQPNTSQASRRSKQPPAIIATVLFDFKPERADELSASKGDTLFLLAASTNKHWYLAKHMSRTGDPGLVPANYVRSLNVNAMGQPSQIGAVGDIMDLPNIHEWTQSNNKRYLIPVKTDSISKPMPKSKSVADLSYGRESSGGNVKSDSKRANYKSQPESRMRTNTTTPLVLSARVPTFTYYASTETFTFRINVNRTNDFNHVIQRTYEDFHSLHLALLTQYPTEAGKTSAAERPKRVIPYLPAPVADTSNEVTNKRRGEIDEYLRRIFSRCPSHIRTSPLLQNFFRPRETEIYKDPPVIGIEFGPEDEPLHESYGTKSYHAGDDGGYLGSDGYSRTSHQSLPKLNNSTSNGDLTQFIRIKIPDPKSNDMVVLKVPVEVSFAEMFEQLSTKIKRGGSSIDGVSFIDDEGDRVAIYGEMEWNDAKACAMSSGGKLVLYAT